MKRDTDLHVMNSVVSILRTFFLLSILVVADIATAKDLFILATGRRDPRIYAIDFAAALKPQNNNTPNAIISRSKVLSDRLDGTPIGDPANRVLSGGASRLAQAMLLDGNIMVRSRAPVQGGVRCISAVAASVLLHRLAGPA